MGIVRDKQMPHKKFYVCSLDHKRRTNREQKFEMILYDLHVLLSYLFVPGLFHFLNSLFPDLQFWFYCIHIVAMGSTLERYPRDFIKWNSININGGHGSDILAWISQLVLLCDVRPGHNISARDWLLVANWTVRKSLYQVLTSPRYFIFIHSIHTQQLILDKLWVNERIRRRRLSGSMFEECTSTWQNSFKLEQIHKYSEASNLTDRCAIAMSVNGKKLE